MNTPPSTSEPLTPQTLARKVLGYTLTRPQVLYPAAVGILGGAAALVLGPSLPILLAAGAGASVALGAWGFDYGVRRDRIADDYVRRLHKKMLGRLDSSVTQLRADLNALHLSRPLEQLDRLQAGYALFERTLREKMAPSELTFGRYLGMAEQVFLAGLDNMRQIVEATRTMTDSDARTLQQKIAALERSRHPNAMLSREVQALREQLRLFEAQDGKRQAWLAENEEAVTMMGKAVAAVAEIDSGQDLARTDMAPALDELQRLVDRASAYDRYVAPESARAGTAAVIETATPASSSPEPAAPKH